jgi:tetratricopeptide (TPR) repeat protein
MGVSDSPIEIESLITMVKATVAANPHHADLRNRLGLLYTLKGGFPEAGAQFLRALRINPCYLEARINLAFLCIQEEKWKEAEATLREYLKAEPESSLCHHILGCLFLMRGDKTETGKCFERAVKLDPFYRLHYERIGALKHGQIVLGESIEKKLIQSGRDQHRVNLHNCVGECFMETGQIEKALGAFRKASRIDINDYRCHLNIGKLHELRGDCTEAIEQFREVVRVFPGSGMAHAHMSYAYAEIGEMETALSCLKRAVEIHPHYADLRYQLGVLYQDLGQYPEAMDELTMALRLNPNYLFARMNLGDLYERLEQFDRALEEYATLIELGMRDRNLIKRIHRLNGLKKTSGSYVSDR